MKLTKICCVIAAFICFAFNANAEEINSTTTEIKEVKPATVVPKKKKIQSFYMDFGLGAIIPTGAYTDASTNLKFEPNFASSISASYYFNDYVGINAMLQVSLPSTEKLAEIVYLKSVQLDVGGGIALRYRFSKNFEIFGDAGVAYSGGALDIYPSLLDVPTPDVKGALAFYGDLGIRAFVKSMYFFGKVKYLGGGKVDITNYGGKADFSGASVLVGVGFAF